MFCITHTQEPSKTEPGCTLVALEEIGDETEEWEASDFGGLPQVILMAARKHG